MRDLEKQMLEVVNLPAENCEPLRFVRYRSSQSFGPHHDAQGQSGIPPHTPGGPRVWTLYVFLSAPDAGGALRFPALNLSVDARAGRAVRSIVGVGVLWCLLQSAREPFPPLRL